MAALVIQIVIISILPGDAWGLSEEIHLATYFMLGAFLVANRHIPGLLVIALGGALNFAAIAANGGVMPADPDAIEAAGIPQHAGDFINSAPASDAPLGFLGDIFHTPAWMPDPQRLQRRRHRDRARRLPAPALRVPLAARRRARPSAARGGMSGVRAFGAALSARGARRFFFAHAQSSLGSGIAIVGLPLLAYDHYHTAWALTAVLLCELLPAVVLGPLLGALADRLPRRTALVAADVLRLGAFGALALVPSLGLMIGCALVAGIGSALFNPSALASGLAAVVAGNDRPAAMSLYSALDDLGLTLGPALAGALLLVVDPHILMAINAGTFTLSAGLARHDPAELAHAARRSGRCSRPCARARARSSRCPACGCCSPPRPSRSSRSAWSTSARSCSRASCSASAAPGSPR